MGVVTAVGVDFDGVVHNYRKGWDDGALYGDLLPGAAEALNALLGPYAVFVVTDRRPMHDIARWLTRHTGIAAILDDGRMRSWTRTDRIRVTERMLPAVADIDDRAIRFESWRQALADLAFHGDRRRPRP